MRKLIFIIGFVLILSSFTISKEEKTRLNEEAENWIDDIPTGLQDRLSDAVVHAQRGFLNEINFFRGVADTTGISNYSVLIQDTLCDKNQNIKIRVYTPAKPLNGEPGTFLIYFHGGGWNLGSIATSDKFCRALSAKGGIKIFSVEYPLAPEHPYPAALNVCKEAVFSIFKNFLKEDDKISLGGDGAGGNLALETFRAILKDSVSNAGIYINSIVAYYPLIKTSGALSDKSKEMYGRNNGFDSRVWEAFIDSYSNPANNLLEKFDTLPPTLIIASGRDIVLDQIIEFSQNNSSVELISFDDSLHGFITDGHQPTAFNLAVKLTSDFLNKN